MTTESAESEPRKRISELVGEELQRQTIEREEEQAFADLSEDSFDASNPGSTFAKRVTQRIQQQRLSQ
jgi:hypothetical protein